MAAARKSGSPLRLPWRTSLGTMGRMVWAFSAIAGGRELILSLCNAAKAAAPGPSMACGPVACETVQTPP